MKRQKLVVISDRQIDHIRDGEFIDFIKNMINLGATILKEDEKIESIQGPFKNTEDDSLLVVINIH